MDMKCAKLYGKNDLRIENAPVPQIGEEEILLRTKAAAVCGTDLRMLQNGNGDTPVILIHEFSGIIEKVGARVKGYSVGARVSVAPNIGCGICDNCVRGKSHHCRELTAMGIHLDGGLAEFVRIPAQAVKLGNVTPIPDCVSFEAAAANEAFSCVYSAFTRYKVNPGDVVTIIGAGAIGLMHAKLAKMAGASKIILNDLSQSRLAECKQIEPSLTIADKDLLNVVLEETNGAGSNVVITACSAAAAQQSAFALASLDGRVNFFGGLPKGRENVELDTNIIHYKQLSVTGTTRSSHEHYRKTLSFIAKGLVDFDPLITHKHPIEDSLLAFDNAAKTIGLKQVIVF